MPSLSHPLQFVLVALAGWMNQQQRDVIDYLQEENRVLREQLGPRRVRFNTARPGCRRAAGCLRPTRENPSPGVLFESLAHRPARTRARSSALPSLFWLPRVVTLRTSRPLGNANLTGDVPVALPEGPLLARNGLSGAGWTLPSMSNARDVIYVLARRPPCPSRTSTSARRSQATFAVARAKQPRRPPGPLSIRTCTATSAPPRRPP